MRNNDEETETCPCDKGRPDLCSDVGAEIKDKGESRYRPPRKSIRIVMLALSFKSQPDLTKLDDETKGEVVALMDVINLVAPGTFIIPNHP